MGESSHSVVDQEQSGYYLQTHRAPLQDLPLPRMKPHLTGPQNPGVWYNAENPSSGC